jgi:hypothetical protein
MGGPSEANDSDLFCNMGLEHGMAVQAGGGFRRREARDGDRADHQREDEADESDHRAPAGDDERSGNHKRPEQN